jgi:hypothetical protein
MLNLVASIYDNRHIVGYAVSDGQTTKVLTLQEILPMARNNQINGGFL